MIKRSILLYDAHCPFQDRKLWRIICKFMEEMELDSDDEVVLGGDFIDFWSISKFDKRPTATIGSEDVQHEREEFENLLISIYNSCGEANIKFIVGNHEIRWNKFLGNEAKSLANVPELEFEEFLYFNEYGVEVIYGNYEVNDNFIVRHGDKGGDFPAKGELNKHMISGACGHCHRTDRAYKRGYNGRLRWYSFGHTADKAKIDDACKYSESVYWDQSIGLVLTDLKSGDWDVECMHCDDRGFYSKYLNKRFRRP